MLNDRGQTWRRLALDCSFASTIFFARSFAERGAGYDPDVTKPYASERTSARAKQSIDFIEGLVGASELEPGTQGLRAIIWCAIPNPLNVLSPHQFRTRNYLNKPEQTRSKSNETAAKSTNLIDIPPLITVWLQVRVLPGPPVKSIACNALFRRSIHHRTRNASLHSLITTSAN
ncbi:hypothetical protein [Bradyrhizobium sp.]|uniref:hypothetical protein n=1 Tax=Bradyrhizobium sp. TaxID=376 RepID=UPI001DD89E90|nr:hypothetical protein [Bradyrhizobium sp.]MBI5321858.1 hypothetical protein [Bradyrhizobium sp.]